MCNWIEIVSIDNLEKKVERPESEEYRKYLWILSKLWNRFIFNNLWNTTQQYCDSSEVNYKTKNHKQTYEY